MATPAEFEACGELEDHMEMLGMIELVGRDPNTFKNIYRLTDAGKALMLEGAGRLPMDYYGTNWGIEFSEREADFFVELSHHMVWKWRMGMLAMEFDEEEAIRTLVAKNVIKPEDLIPPKEQWGT